MASVWLNINAHPPTPEVSSPDGLFFWILGLNLSQHSSPGVCNHLSALVCGLELAFNPRNNVFFSQEKQALMQWSHAVAVLASRGCCNKAPGA